MSKMECVECGCDYFSNKEIVSLPRRHISKKSNRGLCPECFKSVCYFSDKSYEEDKLFKISLIQKIINSKFIAHIDRGSFNLSVPSKETFIKFSDYEIMVKSMGCGKHHTRLDYFGNILFLGRSNPSVVYEIRKCLLNNMVDNY